MIDTAVVIIYVALVLGIGLYSMRGEGDRESYLLGSRSIPWWALGLSIIATAFSASSLLSYPGKGYSTDMRWIQLQFGDLLAIIVVVFLFIPFFSRLRLFTAYEYLEKRFDAKTRRLASVLFILQVSLRTGILLYGTSLLVSNLLGIGTAPAILLVGVVSVAYTISGGITAVVWTDCLQFLVLLAGVLATLIFVSYSTDGGIGGIMGAASESGKWRFLDLSSPIGDPRNLIAAVLGYGLLSLAVAGTNQQPVQRYLSASSAKDASRAALFGWAAGFIGVFLTLLVGVFLAVFTTSHPGIIPEGTPPDEVFPFFISNILPPGIRGLLVVAVFAAAMSSIDSAVNSLATAVLIDFIEPLLGKAGERESIRKARILTGLFGLIGILLALYVSGSGQDLLDMTLKYMGYFAGGVLGLFLLGFLSKRTNGNGAFLGALIGTGLLVYLASTTELPWIWYSAVSLPVTLVSGRLISLLWPPPERDIEGLTLSWRG